MPTFVDVWRGRAPSLPADQLAAVIREDLTAPAVGLAASGLLGQDVVQRVRDVACRFVHADGDRRVMDANPQGPAVSALGLPLSFKAYGSFQPGGFQLYERGFVSLPPPRQTTRAAVYLKLLPEGDGTYRPGPIYAGLTQSEDSGAKHFAAEALARRWDYRLPRRIDRPAAHFTPEDPGGPATHYVGWRWDPSSWSGPVTDLQAEVAAVMLAAYRRGQGGPSEAGRVSTAPTAAVETGEGPRMLAIEELARALAARGYVYRSEPLASYYAALQTKGFVILSGLSGTGKSRLATEFTDLLGCKEQATMMAVRPDWRDPTSLLGYYNPLSGKYASTPALMALMAAADEWRAATGSAEGEPGPIEVRPHFLVLDEMNLARVEYYFADVLSAMESDRILRLHHAGRRVEDDSGHPVPEQVRLPPNLYITGTVNVDETTFAFSPKVLDRAFTIEFGAIDLDGYPPSSAPPDTGADLDAAAWRRHFTRGGRCAGVSLEDVRAAHGAAPAVLARLREVQQLLEPHGASVGYRTVNEVLAFVHNAMRIAELASEDAALDQALVMKVLPKLHGSYQTLADALAGLVQFCQANPSGNGASAAPRFPGMAQKLAAMRAQAQHEGYVRFA